MTINRVWACYFSPTGNSRKIGLKIAGEVSTILNSEFSNIDFTRPENRSEIARFSEDDLVIMVLPTYAGRIPNKILPWVQEGFKAEGTKAVAVATYGNRSVDSALGEIKQVMTENGFKVIAGAAIVSEHAFSSQLAGGRPDADDMAALENFAKDIVSVIDREEPVDLGEREEVAPYYVPKKVDGTPAKFLKAKPVTDATLCTKCGVCSKACPMGSIDGEEPAVVEGICIKCQGCIHVCPAGAKSFDDPDFLSHRQMLIENFTRRAENQFYI